MSRDGVVGTASPERGLLVGVALDSDATAWSVEASVAELAALADTAGVSVVGEASQRLARPNPPTLIGSGKVEELRLAVADLDVDVVIFDRELSPRQQRNLEKTLNVKVVDRTALILDIFAQHARTREGMLQVELAQYEYRLPRLTRMWTHLARQAGGRAGGSTGGVGVRGPGETQIEVDRREIRRRISSLKVDIEELRKQRRLHRRQRSRAGMPVVALVGYTNAGKSTLMNALSQAGVYVADQLFATLDPTTRRVSLPSGRVALFTDTVGFIQRLPTELIAAFRATLEEISDAAVLVQVVDVTHPDVVQQCETVERILGELGLAETPMVVAANKIDLVGGPSGRAPGADARQGQDAEADGAVPPAPDELEPVRELYPELIATSALTGEGLTQLLGAVDEELRRRLVAVEAVIPYDQGELVHLVHSHGVVEHEAYGEDGTRIRALVPRYLLGSLAECLAEEGTREAGPA